MKLVLVKKKRRFKAPFLLHSISGSYRDLSTDQALGDSSARWKSYTVEECLHLYA